MPERDTTFPEGYRLALIRPDGTIVDSTDVGGLDTDKPFDRQDLLWAIDDLLRLDGRQRAASA